MFHGRHILTCRLFAALCSSSALSRPGFFYPTSNHEPLFNEYLTALYLDWYCEFLLATAQCVVLGACSRRDPRSVTHTSVHIHRSHLNLVQIKTIVKQSFLRHQDRVHHERFLNVEYNGGTCRLRQWTKTTRAAPER